MSELVADRTTSDEDFDLSYVQVERSVYLLDFYRLLRLEDDEMIWVIHSQLRCILSRPSKLIAFHQEVRCRRSDSKTTRDKTHSTLSLFFKTNHDGSQRRSSENEVADPSSTKNH